MFAHYSFCALSEGCIYLCVCIHFCLYFGFLQEQYSSWDSSFPSTHTFFLRCTFTGLFLSPLFLLLFLLWWPRLIMWGWVVFAPQTVCAQGQLCPSDSEQPALMGSASQGKSSGKKINHLKWIDLPAVLKCVWCPHLAILFPHRYFSENVLLVWPEFYRKQ